MKTLKIKRTSELVFFLSAWYFSSLWYGDVFMMAREYSFFSTNMSLMQFLVSQPVGLLWLMGRGLLSLFSFPWLGGLVLAGLLTAGSCLFGSLLRLPPRLHALQYIPALACMFRWVWQGFNAFIYTEPGRMAGLPVGILLLLCAATPVVFTFFRSRKKQCPTTAPADVRTGRLIAICTTLLLTGGICLYGTQCRNYVRTTALLQRLMRQQQWGDMIRTAQAYDGSNRQVAAYHAIALHHTGRLLDDLFKIRYDFEPIALTGRNGLPTDGHDIYEADCDFHAGLLQTAYRKDMELNVLDRVCTARLRRMIRYAVMKEETNLALRYLHVLSQQPFETDFTDRYRAMLQNPELKSRDAELSFINRVAPAFDVFEGYLMQPPFIGYYVAMQQPANKEQRDAAMAAALYTRMMPFFLYHARSYRHGDALPATVGDALALAYVNGKLPDTRPELLQPYMARVMEFTKDVGPTDRQPPSDPDHKLFDKYRGYYPYYYFFGNKVKEKNTAPSQEKGEVN